MKTSYQQYNSSIMPAICVFARKGVEFEAAFRLIMEDVKRRDPEWANVASMERRVALKKASTCLCRMSLSWIGWLPVLQPLRMGRQRPCGK